MKNFRVPLPDETDDRLRTVAERSKVPATVMAREPIDFWARQQVRKARHDAIAAYAVETAGTSLDLDAQLETAAVEHLTKIGKSSKRIEARSLGPIWSRDQAASKPDAAP